MQFHKYGKEMDVESDQRSKGVLSAPKALRIEKIIVFFKASHCTVWGKIKNIGANPCFRNFCFIGKQLYYLI